MADAIMPDLEETARSNALGRYAILDTAPEPAFDDLVLLASRICEAPVALISLVGSDRQWFKARIGLAPSEMPIEQSVCRHALKQAGLFVIPDLTLDPRTSGNPLVTGEPHIRFYAGAQLVTSDGVAFGTICVIDTKPRPEGLTDNQASSLEALARQAMSQMELRRVIAERAETALRRSEERFQALANLVPGFLWSSDLVGRATWFSERWYEYSGQSEPEALGYGWQTVIHPDEREYTITGFRAAMDQERPYNREYRIRGKDGIYRWFMVRAEPIRDAAGQIDRCYGAVTDIHDLHELQQRQAVLVDELQHRTRNLLAVVRSIAQQTMTQTGPTEQFCDRFNDRLAALSRVQGLLSRSDKEPITIQALIQIELDAFGAAAMQARVALKGPPVRLRKVSVQTLALALHELATNARKYGSLANEQGRLWVSWDTYRGEDEERRLSLVWQEEGIRRPQEGSPIRRGYGRDLIEKALPYALKARTSYELSEAQLRCVIDLPLTDGAKKRP
ncbi:UNVERIFIED_ORG: PAS domain S-box-containing protein [Methylobacterium sp. SuP10 SLI 274]|nr:PAS domain S-box-containing protein [Methylorubrum extorquens]MDF9789881.1 PAS domain S-box-containing protein [Methylorubrum extorquens]MDF9861588.1 PAS domain S-box-containing protein [Methylorubrum pseudosasae]MDH6635214.1 PAS domain S-box-containing protein [Methylobacterium sp. SuP10 SLI 274]MDH6664384.1 PAS domain S-box-containing protein [Methylorubrum zatmanii]